jgi:hypothetical protein
VWATIACGGSPPTFRRFLSTKRCQPLSRRPREQRLLLCRGCARKSAPLKASPFLVGKLFLVARSQLLVACGSRSHLRLRQVSLASVLRSLCRHDARSHPHTSVRSERHCSPTTIAASSMPSVVDMLTDCARADAAFLFFSNFSISTFGRCARRTRLSQLFDIYRDALVGAPPQHFFSL